ncbi:hypothetical protein BRARA_I05196 [Brassica rapa]|uniref:RNase H type-1 domain-containing protein n=1 Tax=Brassica campestris TaxID=3711 RepID=A0A397Y506_BRACM|nr:hypothetical protein BRARA_I05196 [Brassica rapa]
MRKAVPVSANLSRRGVPSFNCKTCDVEEDDIHVFLKCRVAERVWELAPFATTPLSSISTIASLIECCNTLTTLPPVGLYTPLWPWILWNLWKARNRLCYENRNSSAMKIVVKAISEAREWQSAQSPPLFRDTQLPPNPGKARVQHPLQVRSGMLLCNVDGAWDAGTRNCGTGGVFSGGGPHACLPPISDSRSLVSSAFMAEALAIRSAVMYAASLNIKSLMILSDSQSLVKLLKERGSVPALFGILFDIYHFSLLFEFISFSFVPRLSNVMADSVAKSALSLLNSSSSNGV